MGLPFIPPAALISSTPIRKELFSISPNFCCAPVKGSTTPTLMGTPSCPATAIVPKPAMARNTAALSHAVSFFIGLSLCIRKIGVDVLQLLHYPHRALAVKRQ
jgi:hypothetical protein